jgi:hypothetical protein
MFKTLKDFGKNTTPLGLIGCFLNYAGNHLLSYIYQTSRKKVFYPLHRAVSVNLMQNGEVITKTRKMNCEISVHEKTGRLIYKITESDQFVIFRSKNVVISNGGV